MKKNPALTTWINLNSALRVADVKACEQLMRDERKDKNRPAFIKRIYSRLNKVRAEEERKNLGIE